MYGTECVVQCAHLLMVFMYISMMVMCRPFAHMFKIYGLMCSLKVFMLNLLSLWYAYMLKPLALYRLMNVWSSLMMLYALFEIKVSAVRKVILDDFYVEKAFRSYKKSKYISMFLWCSNISVGRIILGTF